MVPSVHLKKTNELASAHEVPKLWHSSPADGALEPLAIVGFSLKFPQEATSQEAFWSMLMEKRCAMTEWPSDRLNVEAFYHADKTRNDTVSDEVLRRAMTDPLRCP